MRTGPWASTAAARMGRMLFFAVGISTSPKSGRPPHATILSTQNAPHARRAVACRALYWAILCGKALSCAKS